MAWSTRNHRVLAYVFFSQICVDHTHSGFVSQDASKKITFCLPPNQKSIPREFKGDPKIRCVGPVFLDKNGSCLIGNLSGFSWKHCTWATVRWIYDYLTCLHWSLCQFTPASMEVQFLGWLESFFRSGWEGGDGVQLLENSVWQEDYCYHHLVSFHVMPATKNAHKVSMYLF